MYIPKINAFAETDEVVAFMKQFSFATVITAKDNLPVATHLPVLVKQAGDNLMLVSHFAKANDHWTQVENNQVLVIFSEPHAYISPKHYDKTENVPTWNYISIHVYGQGRLITEPERVFEVLQATIDNYETSYRRQWDALPEAYKLKMVKGIVAFEINVTDLQAKKKLSQNRSVGEQEKIIDTLSKSNSSNEKLIADFMKMNKASK